MAGRKEFLTLHKIGLELLAPLQSLVSNAAGHADSLWDDYVALWNLKEENERLRLELQKYKAANNEFREAVATNIRLRKLLEFKETLPAPTLTTEIIGKDPSLWFKTITIDRGSSDGIEKGMPAVTVEGVVGQVLSTSPHFAKVLLATDPNSAIDALTQQSRVHGIVKGRGSNALRMHYVLKDGDVNPGDRVITSGLGGVFPKGLVIGTISDVQKEPRGMFQQIEIEPVVDFSQLEHLIIIMKKTSLAQ